jgi:hypothetical protein
MIPRLTLLASTLALALFSCGAFGGRELPEKRPGKLVIQLYDGGGMVPEGDEYYFSEDSCYAKFWREKATNFVHFKLSSGQLDTLYRAFYDNTFEKIGTREMETYDRGGITVSLRFGDKNYSVSDAGSTYIQEGWMKEFNAVVKAVTAQAAPFIAQAKAPVTIQFSKELLADSLALYFDVEHISYNTDSTRKETLHFNLLRGLHSFHVSLMRNTQPSYQRTSKAWLDDIFTVCGQDDTVFISLQDSSHIAFRKNVDCVQ